MLSRLIVVVLSSLLVGLTVSVGAEEVQPPAPGATIAVTDEDALRWENVQLRITNQELEVWRVRRQLDDYAQQIREARAALDQVWRAKYGIGLDATERRPDRFIRKQEP